MLRLLPLSVSVASGSSLSTCNRGRAELTTRLLLNHCQLYDAAGDICSALISALQQHRQPPKSAHTNALTQSLSISALIFSLRLAGVRRLNSRGLAFFTASKSMPN